MFFYSCIHSRYFPKHFSRQRYLPEELGDTKFYRPSGNGYEKEIEKYLEWIHE